VDGDGDFNWVLQWGRRYWWHDSFAGLWLYYFRGSWWRADGQRDGFIQVYIDGGYYVCDAEGNGLQDMGPDGTGAIISAPGRYQGDFQQASLESHESPGGQPENGKPSQNSP
jgi:hypothetical protein